jgi:flagellum-specific ATP synthase
MTFELPITALRKTAQAQPFFTTYGKVSEVVGLLIKVEGLAVFIGEICEKNRAPDAP